MVVLGGYGRQVMMLSRKGLRALAQPLSLYKQSFPFLLLGVYIIFARERTRRPAEEQLTWPIITFLQVASLKWRILLKIMIRVSVHDTSIPLHIQIWKPHYMELPRWPHPQSLFSFLSHQGACPKPISMTGTPWGSENVCELPVAGIPDARWVHKSPTGKVGCPGWQKSLAVGKKLLSLFSLAGLPPG